MSGLDRDDTFEQCCVSVERSSCISTAVPMLECCTRIRHSPGQTTQRQRRVHLKLPPSRLSSPPPPHAAATLNAIAACRSMLTLSSSSSSELQMCRCGTALDKVLEPIDASLQHEFVLSFVSDHLILPSIISLRQLRATQCMQAKGRMHRGITVKKTNDCTAAAAANTRTITRRDNSQGCCSAVVKRNTCDCTLLTQPTRGKSME